MKGCPCRYSHPVTAAGPPSSFCLDGLGVSGRTTAHIVGERECRIVNVLLDCQRCYCCCCCRAIDGDGWIPGVVFLGGDDGKDELPRSGVGVGTMVWFMCMCVG